MILSEDGMNVLVDREGLRTTAYQDTKGIWTIGVGHTAGSGPPVPCRGMTITHERALEIFDHDNDGFENAVNSMVTVELTQNEFDALVSFVFNIGVGAFKTSTMLRLLNSGDKLGAANQFKRWNKPPEIIPRRRGEQACFQYGVYVARINDDATLNSYRSAITSPQ